MKQPLCKITKVLSSSAARQCPLLSFLLPSQPDMYAMFDNICNVDRCNTQKKAANVAFSSKV